MITFYFSSARSISFPLSFCFVDFHSTPVCCYMTYTPQPHPSPRFLSVILSSALFFYSLGVEVVNREGLISSTVSLCVLLYRHSSASCLFTQPCQLGPHSESMREDMRWDRLPPIPPPPCPPYYRYGLMLKPLFPWLTSSFLLYLLSSAFSCPHFISSRDW